MDNFNEYIDNMKINTDNLPFENSDFSIISIPPSDLSNLDFNDPNYIQHILSKMEEHPVNKDNLLESIAKYSNINKYPACHNMETETIGFNSNHVFEMSFMIFDEGTDLNEIPDNDIGSLLNIQGNKIKGHCIIFKSYISNNDYSMMIKDITKKDMGELLLSRKAPLIVIFEDGQWREDRVGDIEKFKKKLFGDEYVKEDELKYLTYHLKFFYVTSDYGDEAFPEIINKKMESVLIYSSYGNMIDNFTLDELNKIRFLKNKNINQLDSSLFKDEKDHLGRKIINTKYRFLNLMYRKNL